MSDADDLARMRRLSVLSSGCARALYHQYFPDDGPFRRELYRKHLAFFDAGAHFRQRMMLAANRVGKSICAAFELTAHATGHYPAWWMGRRFDKPLNGWAAGDTAETTRDIIQASLLGPMEVMDTREWCGMVPAHQVLDVSRRSHGIKNAAETVWLRHKSGGVSSIGLKSYEQGRKSFQGTEEDLIWLDEEPPSEVHGECLMRLMTTNGILLVTMTPLQGLTEFIADWLDRSVMESFDADGRSVLRPGKQAVFNPDAPEAEACAPTIERSRYTVMAGWDDVPHLSEASKAELLASYQPAVRAARSQGIPSMGAGVIYPIPESEIAVKPFKLPDHWPRMWALDSASDVGWKAAVFAALDPDASVIYLYDAIKRQHLESASFAQAIKDRGDWIPGVGDASGILVTEKDSIQFVQLYRGYGLDLILADKAVETGIDEVWRGLSTGRIKVFSHLSAVFDEYRLYRRDEHGRIVKKNDHLMDCLRYLVRNKMRRAKRPPVVETSQGSGHREIPQTPNAWML